MLLIDSRVWLLWLFCCLPWGGIRAEEFAVIKGKIEGKTPVKEVRLMTVENGGLSKKYLAPSIYSYPYWRLKSNIRFYKGVFCLFGHPHYCR